MNSSVEVGITPNNTTLLPGEQYSVVRDHNGTLQELVTTYDPLTNKLKFTTYKISTYTIVKKVVPSTPTVVPTPTPTVAPSSTPAPTVEPTKAPVTPSMAPVSEEVSTSVSNEVNTVVDDITKGTENTAVDTTTAEKIKSIAISNTLTTKQSFVNIAQYINLEIVIKEGEEKLGNLTELKKPVEFTIAVPEKLKSKNRKFFVIRVHNGVVEKLDTVMNKDGTISFKTDKFSTYALKTTWDK